MRGGYKDATIGKGKSLRTVDPSEISKNIYLVGSSDITDPRDCAVYLINLGELILVDAGAGPSAAQIVRNIERVGQDPSKLSTVASPMPDADSYMTSTIGSVLEDQFAALGLGQYLEIIPLPSRRERLRASRPSDM